jgi:hypothetical protein
VVWRELPLHRQNAFRTRIAEGFAGFLLLLSSMSQGFSLARIMLKYGFSAADLRQWLPVYVDVSRI